MKNFLPLLILCFMVQFYSSANDLAPYKGKTFIFDVYSQATECDILGNPTAAAPILVLKGALFTVEAVSGASLVIKFLEYSTKKDATKYATYNMVSPAGGPPTQLFFLLPKAVFDDSCSEYHKLDKWSLNFGSLTTPFKIRRNPFLFTTNLNLGTSVSFQRKYYNNLFWGVVAGLSISSISMDSISTKGKVKELTERPALTPSLHAMFGYKNINITLGFGWDFINKPSSLEESWIYHGKRWFGIGIGVSLFNGNNEPGTTKPSQ